MLMAIAIAIGRHMGRIIQLHLAHVTAIAIPKLQAQHQHEVEERQADYHNYDAGHNGIGCRLTAPDHQQCVLALEARAAANRAAIPALILRLHIVYLQSAIVEQSKAQRIRVVLVEVCQVLVPLYRWPRLARRLAVHDSDIALVHLDGPRRRHGELGRHHHIDGDGGIYLALAVRGEASVLTTLLIGDAAED